MSTTMVVVIVVNAIFLIALAVRSYRPKYDGSMIVWESAEKKTFSLEINTDPDEWAKKRQIVLKVQTASAVGGRE